MTKIVDLGGDGLGQQGEIGTSLTDRPFKSTVYVFQFNYPFTACKKVTFVVFFSRYVFYAFGCPITATLKVMPSQGVLGIWCLECF